MHISLGAKTMALPLPAWLITTYDTNGRPNVMTASWTGICCSKPPQAYFSMRRVTYTYECMTAADAFTINIPGREQAALVDYCGTASGRDVDKLAHCGLTARQAEHVNAPYIEEMPLILECSLAQTIELGSHVMFIGEIRDVKCAETVLGEDGKPDGALLAPFVYSTLDSGYYAAESELGRGYELGRGV